MATPTLRGAGARKWNISAVLAEWSRQFGVRFMSEEHEVPNADVFSETAWLPMIAARAQVDARQLFDVDLGIRFYEEPSAFFGVAVDPIMISRNAQNQFSTAEELVRVALLGGAARDLLGIHRMRQIVHIDERLRYLQGNPVPMPTESNPYGRG